MPPRVIAALAVAVAAVSTAAVLVRLAEGVPPLAAAFWRTAGVAALLSPWLRPVRLRDGLGVAAAGAFLALHFWTWFESLHDTSVLRSTVLVCLSPVWSGLLEALIFKRRPSWRFWLGIGVALAGVALLGGQGGPGGLRGDLLATLGGVLASAYLLIGFSVRQRVGIGAYGALVCASAAAWLLLFATLGGVPLAGFSPQAWWALLGLTLGPQLLGHIGFNYVVRYVPPSTIGAVVLLEPVGAAALAAVVLREAPTLRDAAGALVVLLGVYVATVSGRRGRPKT